MAKLDWREVLAPDLVRQIEDEMARKFMEGWRSYERTLQERMRDLPSPMDVIDEGNAPDRAGMRAYPHARAPRGFWNDQIMDVLQAASPDRLPYTELMNRVQACTEEYKLARSSFNVSLERLESEGRISKDGTFWFRKNESREGRTDEAFEFGDAAE